MINGHKTYTKFLDDYPDVLGLFCKDCDCLRSMQIADHGTSRVSNDASNPCACTCHHE